MAIIDARYQRQLPFSLSRGERGRECRLARHRNSRAQIPDRLIKPK